MDVPVCGDAPCARTAIYQTLDAGSIPHPSCSLRPPGTIHRKKPDLLLTLSHARLHRNLKFQLVLLFVIPDSLIADIHLSENLGKEGYLVFTFDDERIIGHQMYQDYFPVVWR